jgi:NitT/TauT family transport system substrate-binding protein
MKKIICAIAFSLLLLPSLTMSQGIQNLRLGVLPVIDTLPLIVAEEKGFFRQEGINVQLINFNSALERDAALKGGGLYGYFGDLLNTILLNAGGEDLRIVTTAYHTNPEHRMFALLASPGSEIRNIQQTRDEPVAISTASIIEYLLDEIMAKKHIASNHVKKLEIRMIPIRYQMLINNSVKLALLPEPLATKAVADGAILITDDRILDTTLTIIAIKNKFLTANPNLATRFLRAYAKSVRMINNNPPDFMDTLVNKTRFPASLKGHFTIPLFPDPAPPPQQDISHVGTWLLQHNLIPDRTICQKLIWEGP